MGSCCGVVPQSRSRQTGCRHVRNAATGGKPGNAIGFTSEGSSALTGGQFVEPLDPALEEKGITAEVWAECQEKLRTAWGKLAKADFDAAISDLNETVFEPKECKAIYAEYGKSQAAMTIYSLDVWHLLPP
eukprot:TRINITY_DN98634_c0_g1_i1.p1 TRINITY_DN98634_c0_g1~~TRINITY_DN98634_c0_g1_i1.p1  ORF type:complete len:131 (-),score=28.43 TRINITY_DN98634_c0_g1_i1:47-439(-)